MSALSALKSYGSGGSDEELSAEDDFSTKTSNLSSSTLVALKRVDLAPDVMTRVDSTAKTHLVSVFSSSGSKTKELSFNPKFDDLFAPCAGPVNPFKSAQQAAPKNTLTGFIESAHISDFSFETQRRTFESFGYAQDPSADSDKSGTLIGAKSVKASVAPSSDDPGLATVFESVKERPGDKRAKTKNWDPTNLDEYTGPWAKFNDEETVAKPDPETLKQMEEFAKKRKKFKKRTVQSESCEEKTTLHIKDALDYQGRSFMEAPHDVGVNLRQETAPTKCFIPKKQVHTWTGHTKGVQCIRWFPKTAHLLLSGSMDCKVKLWEVYKGRRCIRTYMGHKMAVRDTCFNNAGDEFLSASYDRYIKLWDTETGQSKQKFHTGKVPYCVKFNPDDDKQHMFLAGMQDKKIIQWDTRSGEIVQEYDRHLGAVNTITFFDQNRRFCTTSDDKSLRIWEWEIPVDTKLIQDPGMHSMPYVTVAPNQKWMAAQSMDNKVIVFQVIDERVRFSKKKNFRGHMVAGYACGVDFSPDMSYVMSGDADGKIFVWDWKTHRILAKWKAHDNVCIGVLWHPHETSKIASCGWDGTIKFWD